MYKNTGYIVVFLFVIFEGLAQKTIENSWDAEDIGRLEIISDQVFNVKIISEDTKRIDLVVRIEGEHFENVVLNVADSRVEGVSRQQAETNTLSISTGFSPYFRPKNDKLAAHKVISIEMELHIPKNLQVFVNASIGSVGTEGSFNMIHLELRNGNCVLRNFEGQGQINTRNGNITVYAMENVAAIAKTRTGSLLNELPPTGNFLITAQSVNGDIRLLKNQ